MDPPTTWQSLPCASQYPHWTFTAMITCQSMLPLESSEDYARSLLPRCPRWPMLMPCLAAARAVFRTA